MARNGEGRKTNVEESKREKVGGGKEVLRPLSLTPRRPFAIFSSWLFVRFPNYLKAHYGLTTCIPSFPTFYDLYSSTWASSTFSTFGALLLTSRNGFGSTNFSTAFRLRNCNFFFSFLFSFFYYFFVVFYRIFLDIFLASLPSLTHSPPLPRATEPCSKQETICPGQTPYFSCAEPNWISSTLERHWGDIWFRRRTVCRT